MPFSDGPVCLTRSAPDKRYAGQLLIFDVVPPNVVSRSGVLSSIAEASGDGSLTLPDFVTLAEFRVWSSTIRDAEIISDCKDMAHACTVLKAADALDDHCAGDWMDVSVNIFREQCVAHHRSGGCGLPQEISDGLSKLPDHLQQRVIEAVTCCRTSDQHLLAVWLDLLPSHHHAAIVSRIISDGPNSSLIAPDAIQSLPFLRALKLLPQSPSSLLSLTLDSSLEDVFPYNCRPDHIHPRAAPMRDRVAALATALRHHSGLTSLRLDPFCDEASLQALAPAIATLTALQALHLGQPYHSRIPHGALPLLKAALQPLSALQELSVFIGVPPDDKLPAKRPRLADSAELSTATDAPRHCLAELLSPMTALTSLIIDQRWGNRRVMTTRPLSLPCLRHLDVTSGCNNVSSDLLSQMTAPLAALVVTNRLATEWSADDVPLAQQLWSSLHKFVLLRSLDIELRMYAHNDQLEDELLARAPAALAPLACLQELRFGGEFLVVLRVVQQLAAGESGVQRLKVECGGYRESATADNFQEFLLSLSRLPLRHLHLTFYQRAISPTLPGLAALQPLTQLTALRVYGWGSCLRRAEDCGALEGMRQLQSLCVCEFSAPPALQADCVRTLGALPALTELALQPRDVADGFQAAFVQSPPGAAWAALQWLGLYPDGPEQAEAIARAVAAFPALKELMLGDDLYNPELGDWEGGEDRYCPELVRAQRVAADAGFAIEVESDWARFDWQSAWA